MTDKTVISWETEDIPPPSLPDSVYSIFRVDVDAQNSTMPAH